MSDAYAHDLIRASLDQIIACGLVGARPLSEQMRAYCQLDPKEHILMGFYFKIKTFHIYVNGSPFLSAPMSS